MDKPGWMFLADTLIRAYLHIDPNTLEDEQWGLQVQMAEWVKADFINNLSKLWRAR